MGEENVSKNEGKCVGDGWSREAVWCRDSSTEEKTRGRLEVAEMKMLSLSLEVTKMNSIKNENVRGRHMLDVLAVKPDRLY